jgi:ATP-dependent helicase/nuclease subunit A
LKLKSIKSVFFGLKAKKSWPKYVGGKLLSQVKKSLIWRYKYGDSIVLAAKQSVTELTHRGNEYARADYSRALDRQPNTVVATDTGLPEPVEARLIGTADHLVIARLDLNKPVNKEAVEKTIERLLTEGAMTEAVAQHINADSIALFFESDLGKNVLEHRSNIQREWPFTFAMPASELSGSSGERRATSDETVVVQGIIDMLAQTPKDLLVIDFKTDNITTDQVAERAEIYRRQLHLYGRAAGAILKEKILAKWLYFLTPAAPFEIK